MASRELTAALKTPFLLDMCVIFHIYRTTTISLLKKHNDHPRTFNIT